jgi:hypothetical protein
MIGPSASQMADVIVLVTKKSKRRKAPRVGLEQSPISSWESLVATVRYYIVLLSVTE